jgi:PKD repeat protein
VPSLFVADFDRDGGPDILTIESTNGTSYTLRLFSAEGLPLAQALPTFNGYPREMMLADFERDGSPEIVLTGGEGSVWVTHVISATGQERPGWPLSGRTAVAIADFDADKLPEIVVKGEGGISIRRADGSLFSPAWPHVEDYSPVYGRPSVADVTGDGLPEVILTRLVRQDSPSPLVTSTGPREGSLAAEPPSPPVIRRQLDGEGQASQSSEPAANVVTWRSSSYLQLVALDRNNTEVRRWNLLGMNGDDAFGWLDTVTAGDFDADGQLDLAVTYPTSDKGALSGGVLTVLKTGAPVATADWPMLNHDPQNTGALIVPDTGAPTVSLVAPAPGATVAGVYTVVAQAADDGWVAGVQFLLDGQPLGSEVTWPPFQAPWDTTASAPGPHQLSAVVRDGAGRTATATPVDVVVSQSSSPTVAIISPTDGQQLSGTVDVQVTVGDDHAVTFVELYVDGTRRATSAIAPFVLRWPSWQDASGSRVLVAKAYDDYGNVTASTPVNVVLQNEAGWDSTTKTPYCATVTSVCDTGTLVDGRGTPGPEPHAPNTVGGTCPDTAGGTYHDSGESVDRVRVFTADGGRFAPGRTVTVETTVWATVFYKSDTLQIFHAPDARAPQWTLVTQLKAPGKGKQILSTSFQLPSGDLQAFRAQYGPSSTPAPACRTNYGYTDHDDVVFQVGTNAAPVAVPGGPYAGLRQQPLAFDGTASNDPDADTLSYSWDFGDGTQGTGPTPTHAYASTGTFTVTLTVSDGVTTSAAASTTAEITAPPNADPVAHAGGPYSGVRQQVIAFDGTGSSDPDGDTLTYSWDFGDGTPAEAGPTPTHAYTTLGTFTVTLTVGDGKGGSSTAAATATITNRAPLASAGPDQTVELGAAVTLVGTGSDPDGDPVALEWRDALGSLVGTTPAVTLTLPLGVHDLTFTVTDGVGGSATDPVRVTVQDITPPVVTVVQPNGVQLMANVAATVEWTAQDNGALAGFDVLYSTNGGGSYGSVPGFLGLPATARTCTWVAPGPATAQGRIRVVARDASSNTGQGESAFTIVDPTMVVTTPNTTVTWGLGSLRTITWTTNVDPAGTVKVELSRDGGSTWSALASSAPNTGSFNWVVAGATTPSARVRVSSNSVPAATDISNVNFTIAAAVITVSVPNTSVRWAPGSSQTIRWNHNLGVQESVKVEISRNGGSTWSVISASVANNAETTGSLAWTVTSPNTTKARIRVSWTTNSGVNDRSDVNFSIR